MDASTIMPGMDSGVQGVDAPGCTDNDHDGICDNVDAWLCGLTAPNSPSSTVFLESQNSNLKNVDFGGSSPRVIMASPGQSKRFSFDWGLQVGCPDQQSSCEAQIEYGIAGVGRAGCAVDLNVNDNQFTFSLGWHVNLTAPTTPAVYEVRAKVGLHGSGCGTSTSWYDETEPDASETIAYICVPP